MMKVRLQVRLAFQNNHRMNVPLSRRGVPGVGPRRLRNALYWSAGTSYSAALDRASRLQMPSVKESIMNSRSGGIGKLGRQWQDRFKQMKPSRGPPG